MKSFEKFAAEKFAAATATKRAAVDRHQGFLVHENSGGLAAMEETERLTEVLATEHLWAYLSKVGLDAGVREARTWLSHTGRSSSTSVNMVRDVKREVARTTLIDLMPYLDDEALRIAFAGFQARNFGEGN